MQVIGTLSILLVISVLLNVGLVVGRNLRRKKQKSIKSAVPVVPAHALSSKRHKLSRTVVDRRVTLPNQKNGQDFLGWHFVCICGTIAPAVDNFGGFGDGSESGAVLAWRNHLNMYSSMVEAGDNELEEVREAFEKYKQECFCHDLERK